MKKLLPILLSVLFVVVLSFAGISTSSAQDKIVLKLGHPSSTIYPAHIGALKMAEEVKKRSNGQIEIEVFPMSQLGNERDLAEGIKLGTVDIAIVSNMMITNFAPAAAVFDLPYFFNDPDHLMRATMSPTGQKIIKTFEEKVGKVLAYYRNGPRSIYNKTRPINTPDDVKGLKLRVVQNKGLLSTFQALDAVAMPIPFSEVYSSLQQGVIDGAENDPDTLVGMKHYETVKYYSLTNHFTHLNYVFMNTGRWNKLTPAQQQIIADAAVVSQETEAEYQMKSYNDSIEKLKELNIVINEVDRAPFVEKVKHLWDDVPAEYAGYVADLKSID